jgi:hypothetical protein
MHTKEPWRVEGWNGHYGRNVLADGTRPGLHKCLAMVVGITGEHEQDEEMTANARLMAAAPDLLAACEAGLALLVRCQGAECWCTGAAAFGGVGVVCAGCKMRAAIAKAKAVSGTPA